MKNTLLLISLAILLYGCATQPVPTDEAIPVPKDRVISSKYSVRTANTGEVIVKRDSGFGGSACAARIYIDGEAVADINVSEKVVSYLEEGDHIVSADPRFCGGHMAEEKTTVKSGKRSTFRTGWGSNGNFFLHPTAF